MPELESVVRGLEICDPDFCTKERRSQCPYYGGPETDFWGNPDGYTCDYDLRHDAINLINAQAEEISNLQQSLDSMLKKINKQNCHDDGRDNMQRINKTEFREEVRPILSSAVGMDYSHYLLYDDGFLHAVKQNVEETSAWSDEGYYTEDDIRLAIGRVIMDKFGIEY